jgi:hypothetical protein
MIGSLGILFGLLLIGCLKANMIIIVIVFIFGVLLYDVEVEFGGL